MSTVTGGNRAVRLVAAILGMIILLVVVGLMAASPARAASAAGRPVQFSDDGVHWSDSYTRALFGGALLVPGGSVDRAFYVRNGAADAAILRVTLYGVATTDLDLASALTLSTSVPGNSGAAVPLTDARPCATLNQGRVLAAGDSVRLDNVAGLADLNGTAGQTHHVSFKLAISLSSTDAAAPMPNSCPSDFDDTVVGSPDPGAGTSTQPVYHLGAGGWTRTPGPASAVTPAPSAPPTAPAGPGDPAPGLNTLVANTQRLYQEDFVALWLAMAVLGALILLVVRRRRRSDDGSAPQYPYSRQPTTQIGTGP